MQNIDEISEHDIIAWTFAQPGAMGCLGEITYSKQILVG